MFPRKQHIGPKSAMLPTPGGERIADLEVDLGPRGNVKADTVSDQTSLRHVFACGDMRRGQSLVVWACPAKAARPRMRSTSS